MTEIVWDVLIVGGGPAGLSAALVLGRARRRVLVVDDGRPRNWASRAVHGFLSRDGTPPAELRRIAREQLARYPDVELREGRVIDGVRRDGLFELTLGGGAQVRGRRVVIATGVQDELPAVEGLRELYGTSVFHCPHCDGWEVRDRSLAAYGRDDAHGPGLALELRAWSDDVVFCADGSREIGAAWRQRLARNGIRIVDTPLRALAARDGRLAALVFTDGETLARDALFFSVGRHQPSDLARRLGCEVFAPEGCRVDPRGRSDVPGVYIIGDASRDVLQVSVAAGEGATAAITLNAELIAEDHP
jgi:thioredoxin reductase